MSRIFTLLFLALCVQTKGALLTSVQNGDWTNPATWDCNCTPNNNDDVVIASGHDVMLDGFFTSYRVRDLNIQPGATLTHGFIVTLEVRGDYNIDGIQDGFGFVSLRGNNSFLSGSGTVQLFLGVQIDKTLSVSPGASLTFALGSVNVRANRIITNNGSITVLNNLTADNNTSQWINAAGSYLSVSGSLLTNGILQANAAGNTVEYAGASQAVKQPLGDQYHHLTLSGSGTKTLPLFPLTLLGDLSITNCNMNRQGMDMYIAGNWTNSGGTHTYAAGTVFFNGAVNQTISHTSTEHFFNLDLGGAGTKILNGGIHVHNDITINSGLDVGGASNPITLEGQWYNNGTFNQQAGLVTLAGTIPQNIYGLNTFHNLTLNNAAGATLQASQNISGTVLLNSGQLTLGAFDLILLSNASGTARIGTITGGSISGQITMQRFVDAGPASWRFLAVPVTGRTYADWMDDVVMTGFAGSQFPAFGWTSVYTYDETTPGIKDFGYMPATSISNPVNPGNGYWVYMGTAATTIDVKGPAVTGNFSFPPLTYTPSSAGFLHDGWNQVGNPYPSNIDWDATTGWTKTNVDNAIYIWSSQLQQYTAYVAGIGVNGGSRFVASSQSFWVHANAASPSLACAETVKSGSSAVFRPSATDFISLMVSSSMNNIKDQAIIRFDPLATDSLDGALDAVKFLSDNANAPSLFTITDSIDYAINSLAWNDSIRSIPVMFSGLNGTYTLQADLDSFNHAGACLVLQDLQTGNSYDLATTPTITFQNNTSWQGPRFMLNVYPAPDVTVTSPTCSGNMDAVIYVASDAPFTSQLYSSQGTLLSAHNGTGTDTVSGLAPGTYHVIANPGPGCSVDTSEVEVTATTPVVYSYFTHSWDCEDSVGMLSLLVSGGTPPYNTMVGAAQGTDVPVASGSVLPLAITDANGCTKTDTLLVSFNDFASADFAYTASYLDVTFQNLSSGAANYLWDFGDGNYSSIVNPQHSFSSAGAYFVTLISSNDSCSAQQGSWINVTDPTAIREAEGDVIRAWYSEGLIYFTATVAVRVEVFDITGKRVMDMNAASGPMPVGNLAPGVYQFRCTAGGEVVRGGFVR